MRSPVPKPEELAEEYESASALAMAYAPGRNVAWDRARADAIERFDVEKPLQVLDIGCHTGLFLSTLPECWNRHGIESSHAAIQVAQDRHQVQIIAPRLGEHDPVHEKRYDLVTMFDVLEHLPDPAWGLRLASRFVRKGGVLFVSTGDMDAWTWRWLGSGHWYVQSPQHLSVLSGSYLRAGDDLEGLRLQRLDRIAHQQAPLGVRFSEAVRLVYWGMRLRRGLYKLPHRLLQSMPGLGKLRHMTSVPWCMSLTDHLIGVYEDR